jgi:ferrous iron transport protein A
MTDLRLGRLKVGQAGVVDHITNESSELGLRLKEFGLVKGEIVRVVHQAPLGDPIAVKIRGTIVALRRDEADHVMLEP